MQTFTGRCLCGQSHFTVDVEMLDVYACHCTLCQKWSGGIAMYLEACGQPQLDPLSRNRHTFHPLHAANATSVPAAGVRCGFGLPIPIAILFPGPYWN